MLYFDEMHDVLEYDLFVLCSDEMHDVFEYDEYEFLCLCLVEIVFVTLLSLAFCLSVSASCCLAFCLSFSCILSIENVLNLFKFE